MTPSSHNDRDFLPLNLAVLTVSDTRSLTEDRSGDLLAQRILDGGHQLFDRRIVRDDKYAIRAVVSAWIADPACQGVITTGGTGLTGRDGTPEALRPLFDKEIEGFGEVFRWLSWQAIGTSTVQSRATAGVANGTYLFVLPGSTSACRDAWDQIIRAQLDFRTGPCNMVELMPRLNEK
ncbi:MAG: molybdenum cofactor biosynthesis protein B [Halothiobacillus sp.]|jgi:molybdenum cofactor biosynthesis protein B|uniref:molybdenum cofactor biosynthesis protein B n=1 Tax=Halothiobacillus sp. TaxID=1891311 RepID=UPI002AD3F2A3|nr:molybdenum cofactor biosynthesis protein B [Halothiobacillus sp.]MDA3877657.1 molybdenum cofactor biosynthesis protein B [Halothiobacillus sp.]